MSQENIEIVRRAWDAWIRGDPEGMYACYADDVVWDLTHFRDWPENTYRGIDGVRRFFAEWLEVWDALEVGVDEIFAAPDGRVLSLAWNRAKGRTSGAPMEFRWGQIATIEDGRICRLDNYDDRDEALAAAGLQEHIA
jgi:ketosteroid isomerase-like protein